MSEWDTTQLLYRQEVVPTEYLQLSWNNIKPFYNFRTSYWPLGLQFTASRKPATHGKQMRTTVILGPQIFHIVRFLLYFNMQIYRSELCHFISWERVDWEDELVHFRRGLKVSSLVLNLTSSDLWELEIHVIRWKKDLFSFTQKSAIALLNPCLAKTQLPNLLSTV